MAIFWLTEDFEPTLSLFAVIGLHAIGILYFWKIHPKLFKPKQTALKSFLLSLVGIGFGQVYNRQLGKGLFFASLAPVSRILVKTGIIDGDGSMVIIFTVIAMLSLIDAAIGARSVERRMNKTSRNPALQAKVDKILHGRLVDEEFKVDAQRLMDEPDLFICLLEESFMLTMSTKAFDELNSLKGSNDPFMRKQAQLALEIIDAYQREELLEVIAD